MKTEEMTILAIAGVIFLKLVLLDKVLPALNQFKLDMFSFFLSLLTWKTLFVLLIILFPLFIYLNYKINARIYEKREEKKQRQSEVEDEVKSIKQLLSTKPRDLDLEEMQELIKSLKREIILIEDYEELSSYTLELENKLSNCWPILKELKHKAKVDELEDKKEELREEIEELEKQIKEKQRQEDQKKRDLLEKLNIEENPVFLKLDLNDKQIQALLEKGYSQINEYCVEAQKIISVLIRPVSNHSKTHVFLVWSVKKLLESINGIYYIQEHLSKDADITFYYNKKRFGLEIETGTLLGKTAQTEEKLRYMNRKYENRWMFIVSNKNLLPKYKKIGFATQRIEVAENLKKLLDSTTRFMRVENQFYRGKK